jgi:hypothetical protein
LIGVKKSLTVFGYGNLPSSLFTGLHIKNAGFSAHRLFVK